MILETPRLTLRPLTLADAETAYYGWTGDAEINKWVSWLPHHSLDDAIDWLKEISWEQPVMNTFCRDNYIWGFVLKETGTLFGSGGLIWEEDYGLYQVGYNIGKAYWNNSYTTEAMRVIFEYAAKNLGIKRLVGGHAKANPASGAVLRKLGFVYDRDEMTPHIDGIRVFDSREYYLDLKDDDAMTNERSVTLANSLSAGTTEILPFLPYLLQDFWEIGSNPEVMIRLIEKHVALSRETRVLDICCGKGAVSVKVAEGLNVKVKGIDILPEFIEVAKKKAAEYRVTNLCEFIVGEANGAIKSEKNYDVVIFGAAGAVLGEPAEMLRKLKSVIKPDGYILIDEGFLPDGVNLSDVKNCPYELLPEKRWARLFKEAGLTLIETIGDEDNETAASGDSKTGMAFIRTRANELAQKHPDKKELFDEYVRCQQDEYDDIEGTITCVTWILRKER